MEVTEALRTRRRQGTSSGSSVRRGVRRAPGTARRGGFSSLRIWEVRGGCAIEAIEQQIDNSDKLSVEQKSRAKAKCRGYAERIFAAHALGHGSCHPTSLFSGELVAEQLSVPGEYRLVCAAR
jgi:hypothetical protein